MVRRDLRKWIVPCAEHILRSIKLHLSMHDPTDRSMSFHPEPWLVVLSATVLAVLPAMAQLSLSNGSPSVTENFDALGSALSLPASWRMHASTASPVWATASTAVTQQASSGSPTAGGTYNWGTSATERAIGAMTSGGFASPNNLLGYFSNAGSTNITALNVSYQAERYRQNSAAASVQFHWSTDGSTWSSVPSGDIASTAFPTGTSTYGFGPLSTVAVPSFTLTPAPSIPPGGSFYLRWNINTTGANSQGIGIDDVTVVATFAGGAGPSVGFASSTSSITEGATASIGVSMLTAPSSNVVVTVTDASSGSASAFADYVPFAPLQLTFTAGGTYPQVQNVEVLTLDDASLEPSETVVLGLAITSGTATAGITSHTLTVQDNDLVAITGCSSSQSPYILNSVGNTSTTSILTAGDVVGGYKMVGDPDGIGAFDNGNGTFTVLMNHEISNNSGIVRAHGSTGSLVSEWVIDKNSLCVQSGQDLIQSVRTWNGSSFVAGTTAFNRFCSADLPGRTAFYNVATGKGTLERIYMNGEEGGTEGRAFAHIVTGPNAGVSWQLPWLGRCNWENQLACPVMSDKTIVVGTDDATPGQVYVYIGAKQNTGTEVERAGLQNGHVFGVAVSGLATEVVGSFPAANTPFALVDLGDVHNLTGAQLNTNSNSASVTNFLRPEDGAWDPANPGDFYFNTTDAFTSPSRMWRLRFTNLLQPELGGTITAVLDGTEGQKMLDNMTITGSGQILLQEDVGNQAHLGKIWRYDIATDALSVIAQHDAARFVTGGANFLTQDEESSGILDVSHILGAGRFLVAQMAHYATTAELVEGGQLLLLNSGAIATTCVAPGAPSITGSTTIGASDTLYLSSNVSGTPPFNYTWAGTGQFLSGTAFPAMKVSGAASGTYSLTVSNGCGTSTASVNVTVTNGTLRVAPRAFLEGPFDGASLMRDDLRVAGAIPLTEPYTVLGYSHVGGGGGESVLPSVLSVTGNNAIVDWVLVELITGPLPATVLASRSALIQRDGDVVATDGVSPVTFNAPAGSYNIALRHRNHFGCMTAVPVALSSAPTTLDLTSSAVTTYGVNARKAVGGFQVLWSGNVVRDNALRYTGGANDRDPILVRVGSTTPNNTASGYLQEDVNLDGLVRYTGASNDRDPILVNIGSTTPNNVRTEQIP